MSRRISLLQCALGMLVVIATTSRVRADDGSPIRLEVAGEPCATAAVLERKIAERSGRILFSRSEHARELRAEFTLGRDGAVLARLSVQRAPGEIGTRELQAPTCEEAVEALALVAAVTLDPSLVLSEPPIEKQPAAPEPTAPPPAQVRSVRPLTVPPASISGSRESAGVALSAGAGFLAVWGPAPELLPGAAAYFGIGFRTGEVLSPSLRISALHVRRGGFASQHGTAHFALTGGKLELCPVALTAAFLELRPCGMFDAGVLSARGSRTESVRTERRPWATLGASSILEARVSDGLALWATGALGRALVRDSFEFNPEVFHRVPVLAFHAGMGARVRFP